MVRGPSQPPQSAERVERARGCAWASRGGHRPGHDGTTGWGGSDRAEPPGHPANAPVRRITRRHHDPLQHQQYDGGNASRQRHHAAAGGYVEDAQDAHPESAGAKTAFLAAHRHGLVQENVARRRGWLWREVWRSVDWSINLLVDSVCFIIRWSIDRLIDWLVGGSVDWLIDDPGDWLCLVLQDPRRTACLGRYTRRAMGPQVYPGQQRRLPGTTGLHPRRRLLSRWGTSDDGFRPALHFGGRDADDCDGHVWYSSTATVPRHGAVPGVLGGTVLLGRFAAAVSARDEDVAVALSPLERSDVF